MTGPDLIPVVLAENCDRRQWVESTYSPNGKAAGHRDVGASGSLLTVSRPRLVDQPTAAKADYVDDSIMWNHDRDHALTAHLERKAPISNST